MIQLIITSKARELAWKFRCAEIKSINSAVKFTLDCSNAEELIVPKVPEPPSPASASPELILSFQELFPICVKPCSLAKLTKAIRAKGSDVPLLYVARINHQRQYQYPLSAQQLNHPALKRSLRNSTQTV